MPNSFPNAFLFLLFSDWSLIPPLFSILFCSALWNPLQCKQLDIFNLLTESLLSPCSNQNLTPASPVSPFYPFRWKLFILFQSTYLLLQSSFRDNIPLFCRIRSPLCCMVPHSTTLYHLLLLSSIDPFCCLTCFFPTQLFSSSKKPLKLYVESLFNTQVYSLFSNSLHWPLIPSNFHWINLEMCHP